MKNKKTLCLFFLIVLTSNLLLAQSIPEYKKGTYIDSQTGKVYWNKDIPFGVKVFSPIGDNEVTLKSDQQDQIFFDSEGLNTIRSPWLVDAETKNYIYPQTDVVFKIYADGLPPISTIKFSSEGKLKIGSKQYYGNNLKINITSKDATSGVKEFIYSLDGADYKQTEGEFKQSEEGEHTLKYLAVDNVGNVEKEKTVNFTVDKTAPSSHYSVTGIDLKGNIISAKSKITLHSEDNGVGVSRIIYSIDKGKDLVYKGGLIPISQLENGEHTIYYRSVDKLGNSEDKKKFEFYLDKLAPILSSDVLGDRYVVNDKIYFSGRTKLKLTAVDNKSGVQDIMYSINKQEFMPYTDPFYLPSVEGLHTIVYYALDNTGNNTGDYTEKGAVKGEEFKHMVIKKIFTDLVGPSLNHKFSGLFYPKQDTIFLSPTTKINLNASDGESGLQYISYSIDGQQEETKYIQPFSIKEKGFHSIEFFAYDNVNNRNKSSFNFCIDADPPIIYSTFSIPSIANTNTERQEETYPAQVKVYLAAKDMIIGTDRIYYSLNGGELKLYRDKIDDFVKNSLNVIKIVAIDKLENRGEKEVSFFVSD